MTCVVRNVHFRAASTDHPSTGLDILKGTAADRAGLRRGDRIVEIAGHPGRELGAADLQTLGAAPANNSLAIRTADQRRRISRSRGPCRDDARLRPCASRIARYRRRSNCRISQALASAGGTHSNSGNWCRNQVNWRLA